MNRIDIGRAARRWAWLIVLLGVISAVTAAAVSFELPRVYATTTTALVNPRQFVAQASQAGVDPGLAAGLGADTLMQDYVSLVNASPTAKKLIADGIPRSQGQLQGSLTATVRKGTTLLDITVHDTDPQVALAIAQDVVPAFNSSLQSLQASNAAPGTTTPKLDALVPWEVPSQAPTVPVSPKTRTNILVALAAGLMLGAALAALLEFMDKSLKSEADVRLRLGMPLLGAVMFKGKSKGFTSQREAVALVTLTHPQDPVSEAYKAIRTNLLFNSVDRRVRTMVVSSTIPGEGKTSTACNLAVTMAQAGNRVILVDADFRRPEIHRVFHKSRNVGLGNFILGEMGEAEVLLSTDVPNLRVMCSGPTPPNPSELLGSARMQATIEKLKAQSDVVIFDTPPVGAVTDATILAARADGIMLVVERGRTPVDAILQAKVKLEAVGANVLGVVLNKVRSGDAGAYYYYKYYVENPQRKGNRGAASRARAKTEQEQAVRSLQTPAVSTIGLLPETNPSARATVATPTGSPPVATAVPGPHPAEVVAEAAGVQPSTAASGSRPHEAAGSRAPSSVPAPTHIPTPTIHHSQANGLPSRPAAPDGSPVEYVGSPPSGTAGSLPAARAEDVQGDAESAFAGTRGAPPIPAPPPRVHPADEAVQASRVLPADPAPGSGQPAAGGSPAPSSIPIPVRSPTPPPIGPPSSVTSQVPYPEVDMSQAGPALTPAVGPSGRAGWPVPPTIDPPQTNGIWARADTPADSPVEHLDASPSGTSGPLRYDGQDGGQADEDPGNSRL